MCTRSVDNARSHVLCALPFFLTHLKNVFWTIAPSLPLNIIIRNERYECRKPSPSIAPSTPVTRTRGKGSFQFLLDSPGERCSPLDQDIVWLFSWTPPGMSTAWRGSWHRHPHTCSASCCECISRLTSGHWCEEFSTNKICRLIPARQNEIMGTSSRKSQYWRGTRKCDRSAHVEEWQLFLVMFWSYLAIMAASLSQLADAKDLTKVERIGM